HDPVYVGYIHSRRYVRTFENPLDRHYIRVVIGDPLAHGAEKPLESLLQWNMGLGAHHPHRDRKHCATLAGLHDGEPAAGQTWVDTHDPLANHRFCTPKSRG